MRSTYSFARANLFCLAILFCVATGAGVASAQDKDWRPVTPEELQMKAGRVEPDADAEAIFWEVRIDDSSSDDLSRQHYVRVKVLTERGREKFSKFDIPFLKGNKVKDIAARVIRPDGSIVEIKKEDIFEREIVRASGVKVRAKSFAIPNIEPGVIVEYRYKEIISDAGAVGSRIQFQRDIPVENLTYYYRPYGGREPQTQSYNFSGVRFVKDKGGYYVATRTDVPAVRDEPRMPPDDQVRAWMLLTGARPTVTDESAFSISYVIKDPSSPQKYWAAVSAEKSIIASFMNKPNKDVKKAAEEITAGAQTQDEKLRKLYEFCQREIANTTFDTKLTDDDRRKLPETKNIGDVLKRKSGSARFIDMLFGAMANSLGMEARIGVLGNRNEMFFDPKMTNEDFVHVGVIGVKVGDNWKYFDPGMKFLPYGMLVWYEEDTYVMLVGPSNFIWDQTPYTGYDKTQVKRNGKFELHEDGTLEGTVTMEYGGQMAVSYREDNYDDAPAKREEDFRTEIKARLSNAEISNVSIENVDDPTKPLIKRYTVKMADYAQKTGKRLFLQPGFFEYGVPPLFSAATRKYDIFFQYPWSENDTIEIKFPASFDLDNADAPSKITDPQSIGLLDVSMKVDHSKNILYYNREFHFGGGDFTLFKAKDYTLLKNMFDTFQKADSHTITLKQK